MPVLLHVQLIWMLVQIMYANALLALSLKVEVVLSIAPVLQTHKEIQLETNVFVTSDILVQQVLAFH